MELRTFVSAFSLRVPRTNSIVRASTVTRPSLTRGVAGPGSPDDDRSIWSFVDVIERALCVGGDLRAVGEMDVAVEIRLLDGAEARLRLHGQRQRARDALDRGDVLPRRAASRDTRRCRRRSRSAGRCRAPLSPVSVADRMRLAGRSPSAGRSTWTFSVALRLVSGACRPGPCAMSIVLAGDPAAGAPAAAWKLHDAVFHEQRVLERAPVVGVRQIDVARRHGLRRRPRRPLMRLLPRSSSFCTRSLSSVS